MVLGGCLAREEIRAYRGQGPGSPIAVTEDATLVILHDLLAPAGKLSMTMNNVKRTEQTIFPWPWCLSREVVIVMTSFLMRR